MTPERLLHLEMAGFLYSLAAIITYKMLSGSIVLTGLLSHKDGTDNDDDDPELAPGISTGRLQLLLATIATGATYLTQVMTAKDGTMPDISRNWLYLFGGSGSIYVVEKAWNAWKSNNNS